MLTNNFARLWAGPHELPSLLLHHLKQLPFKNGITPGGGRNEHVMFGHFPKDIVVADFSYDTYLELSDIAVLISDIIRKDAPVQYDSALKRVHEAVPHDQLFGDSIFSTGVVHRNYEGDGHHDMGAVPGSLVASLVLRDGHSSGGWLIVGEHSFQMRDGSFAVFNGREMLHSVSRTINGDRYSILFTARTGLS